MLNYRKYFLLILIYFSLRAIIYSQNTIPNTSIGYSFQVNKFEAGLMGKPLNIIDAILEKFKIDSNSISDYFESRLKTHEKLDIIEKRDNYKIISRYDSSGFLIKKKFKKQYFRKKAVGKMLPFQMLNCGNGFYHLYTWENKEKKYERFMGFDAPVLSKAFSLDVLIIEDTTLKLLFFFSDIDNPEYHKIDFFPNKKPPLTFANYQSITIFNEKLMPIGLITRSKGFKNAHIIILNSVGFYDSAIRLSWENLKKRTLSELILMIQEIPQPNNRSKIYDKKLYKEYWSGWGSTIRYNWKF
jgi:hypothetical protein